MEAQPKRSLHAIVIAAGLVAGIAAAAAYAAWRAVSVDAAGNGARWSEFGEAMLFPGALIIAVTPVIFWLGWNANIDG